jgi:signal transduction histidine kinase
MLSDIFPFLRRTIPPGEFERSVFNLVSRQVSDRKALAEELAGVGNLRVLPPSDEKRQKMAAELYLLLERNISQEQARNRVPPEVLRGKVLNQCHPERATSNLALLFLPHYERQIKLFERFTTILFSRGEGILGVEEYSKYIKFLASEIMQGAIKNNAIAWHRIERQTRPFTPPVRRDMIQNALKRAFGVLIGNIAAKEGEARTELLLREVYHQYRDPIDFVEDVAKVLVLIPDTYLPDERIEILGKAELEAQLREKSQALQTTLAEVQGERIKLSELTREELEKKVQERTAELVSALEAAQEARKNLEEFSSLATHELRTPVAAMKGYINLILADKAGTVSEEQRRYIEQVSRGNERLLTLINAMLDVSRIELGTLAIEPSPVNLMEIVDGVFTELAARIKEKHQKIIKRYDVTVPIMNLDPSLTHAIIINLLSNAIKYTSDSGTITIETQKRPADVLIAVTDTGFGIPKVQQPHIFEKMFRADNAKTKIAEGTGLGLYLVKSILDQTGGKIWFDSEENKGTTFFMTIPLSGMERRQGTKGLS